jgi:hypothetical protein
MEAEEPEAKFMIGTTIIMKIKIPEAMKRKIVFDPEDYSKIAEYISAMPVPFSRVEQAAEIKVIMKKAVIMDIELKEENKA